MRVVGIVEDELVANADETTAERTAEVLFGEDFLGCAHSDRCGIQQENVVAAAGLVEVVGRHHDCTPGRNLFVHEVENDGP